MIHEFKNPIPVITEHGEGYVWYVRDGGNWENDIFCIILCEGGVVRHYRSDQFNIHKNATFNIHEQKASKETKEAGEGDFNR